jgi:KDO2-lipid IV(A) lauroyltransferase
VKQIRHVIEEKGLLLIGAILRLLPRSLSLKLGETIGCLIYWIGIRRSVALENLAQAFPDWPRRRIRGIAQRCYRHFGALLADFSRLPSLNKKDVAGFVEIEGLELLDKALRRGKGGVVVSGHLGNWELMGSSAAVLGYPVSYVVTGQENERVDELMDCFRRKTGVQIIKRREAIKGVLKALRENRLVAILSDQDAHEAGVFVPFFGREASTPRGAALFAIRSGAELIFAESYLQQSRKLKVIFQPVPREDLPDDFNAAADVLTGRFTRMLEDAVRRHPEQWFWMHRRWKSRPQG